MLNFGTLPISLFLSLEVCPSKNSVINPSNALRDATSEACKQYNKNNSTSHDTCSMKSVTEIKTLLEVSHVSWVK